MRQLEVNAQPLRDLRALIEKIGESAVCRQLNVHVKTLYRWRTGRVALPGHQHQAIRMLLGDLPGTCGKWSGWRFHQGELVSPAGDAFDAGSVLSLILLRQQLTAQQREIVRLKARLAIAVALNDTTTGGVCALLGIPSAKSVIEPGTLVVIYSLSMPRLALAQFSRHCAQ